MTQIVRVGEPAAMPTPEGVMVLIPRPDGSKRLYASRDMTGAALMTDGLDGDAGYNLGVKRMRNVLIIDGPDYGHCLRKMAEIWANQDREAARVAALEAERKTRESLTMTRGEIESGLERPEGSSLGEQQHDAERCDRGGRPHLGPCTEPDNRFHASTCRRPRSHPGSCHPGSLFPVEDPGEPRMIHDETALRKVARRLAEPTTAEKMLAAEAVEAESGGIVEGMIVPGRPPTMDEFLEEHERLREAARAGELTDEQVAELVLRPSEPSEKGATITYQEGGESDE